MRPDYCPPPADFKIPQLDTSNNLQDAHYGLEPRPPEPTVPEFASEPPPGWDDREWLVYESLTRGGIFIRHISESDSRLCTRARKAGRVIELCRSSILRDGELSDVRYEYFCGRFNRMPKINKSLLRSLNTACGSILTVHCSMQFEYAKHIIRHAIKQQLVSIYEQNLMRADFIGQELRFGLREGCR